MLLVLRALHSIVLLQVLVLQHCLQNALHLLFFKEAEILMLASLDRIFAAAMLHILLALFCDSVATSTFISVVRCQDSFFASMHIFLSKSLLDLVLAVLLLIVNL